MELLIPVAALLLLTVLLLVTSLYTTKNIWQDLQNKLRAERLSLYLEGDLWVVQEGDTILAISPFQLQAQELLRRFTRQGRQVRLGRLSGYIADTYWQGAADAVVAQEAKCD
jgi:hypothetical protein